MKSTQQSGVALVLTLIMLSVITVIAVAFLSVTRQERKSVEHSGYYTDTEQMTIAALRRVQGEMIAHIVTSSNTLGRGFLVSLNLDGSAFDGTVDLTPADIGNLLYDPRVPVFVNTNRSGPVANEFRFYLDLNRNGSFDETGRQWELDAGGDVITTNDVPVTNYFTGDPHWIGILSDPELAHARTNRFVGRYAYIVVPIGQTLDLNTVHNDSRSLLGGASPAFYRQQGVGPWEINLAAFLADLNTNVWGGVFDYNDPTRPPANFLLSSSGLAFQDAYDLLQFRYGGDINNLETGRQLFDPAAQVIFTMNGIDEYATGLGGGNENDNVDNPWPGADSAQHFYSLHDLWSDNTTPGYPAFVGRLRQASVIRNVSTYDRLTFYRLLSQMSTHSEPEEEDYLGRKVHLNYDNFSASQTNLIEWAPLDQFGAIADRLLLAEEGLSVTNIPVFTNMSARATNGLPLYSGRVHQLVQMAANIADATRPATVAAAALTNAAGELSHLPTVYKPIFEQRGTDVFVVSYEQVDGPTFRADLLGGRYIWHDLDNPNDRPDGTGTEYDQYYGVPMIVAARKGHPNFNEAALQTVVQVTRKLELRKTAPDQRPNEVNQMFILGVSNVFAAESWNSYSNAYPRGVQTLMAHSMTAVITNDQGFTATRTSANNNFMAGMANVTPAGTWAGGQFQIPGLNQVVTLSNSIYYSTPAPGRFIPVGPTNTFERSSASFTNIWGLTLTNRLQFFMFEPSTGHLIDAVSLGDLNTFLDISAELNDPDDASFGYWNPTTVTTPYGQMTQGMLQQIMFSAGQGGIGSDADEEWARYSLENPGLDLRASAQTKFAGFLRLGSPANYSTELAARAPFSPTKRLVQVVSWQVNDPLVHYRSDDLRDSTNNVRVRTIDLSTPISLTNQYNVGQLNDRYRPWGKEQFYGSGGGDPNDMNPAAKDPGMRGSDHWNFPAHKLSGLGELGRVHRGTPWQSIYMKSERVTPEEWLSHVGAAYLAVNNSLVTAPTNDWRLFNHFTTAPHPNAERGKLSVNQEGLAAWSAVLSGVPIRRMTPAGIMTDVVVQPVATQDAAVRTIVEGINQERTRHPLGRFNQVGDVLATPELTDASPFLQGANLPDLTEEDYEQIPRQIFSLLTVGASRFAVYAFGQSLRPARDSIILAGPDRGLCTNYQVTGESALRAIVRMEFDPITLDPTDPDFNKPDTRRPRAVIESFNLVPIE